MPKPGATRTIGALAVLGMLAATGCSSSNASDMGDNVLRFAVGSDSGCVDPQQNGSNDSVYPTRQVVDSLTDQDPETGEIVPWLAESWEINDDATEFTFHLRDDATFSNGDPVDAEAVKTNLDRATDLGARAELINGWLNNYESTEVHDEHSLTVTFDEPSIYFLQATSTHALGILHPDSAEQSDDERCAGVVGSGPFVLEDYTTNKSISFSAREDYDWGSSLWDNQSRPHVDGVEFSIVPESGVRAGSLQSDQFDIISNVAPQDEQALKDGGAHLETRTNPGEAFGLRVNQGEEFFTDPQVREAVSSAINREEIVDIAWGEDTEAATSVLSGSTPTHADVSQYLEFDPEHAEELLDDAGYTLPESEDSDDAPVREREDGQRAEFEILWFDNAPANSATVELIQQQLADVGIEVTLKEGQIAEWQPTLNEGNYDTNWGNSTSADPDTLRGSFHSQMANQYRMPEDSDLDDDLMEQAALADEDEREELSGEIQDEIVGNYHYLPVLDLTSVFGVHDGVSGFRFDSGSRVHLNDIEIEDGES